MNKLILLSFVLATFLFSTTSARAQTCDQIAALDGISYDSVQAYKRDLFGKPLLKYSESELEQLEKIAKECLDRTIDSQRRLVVKLVVWENLNDGLRTIRELRKIHRRDLAYEQKDNANAARKTALRAGTAQVSNIRDAMLLHDPVKSLTGIMYSPLVTVDNNVYAGKVVLELEEEPGLLRVRWGAPDGQTPTYGYIRLSKQTKIFSPDLMRGDTHISVVGRYVKNVKYRTVAHVVKLAPLLDAMYIGAPPQ